MAGYTGLATYGDNKAGGWRLISLASYEAIMKPVGRSHLTGCWLYCSRHFRGGSSWPLAGAPPG